ncbi:MAG: heme exporter protein CcmB [Gammaproteobacteria bacterium]|nr:heme exporter protein CcmB [Gammaproteobacteria bacterium]
MNPVAGLIAQLRRDLRVAFRRFAELANPLLFFAGVIMLFPLSLSPDPQLLGRIAPGIIWVAALFSILLAQDNLFRPDYEDGSLEQMAITAHPLAMLVAGKLLAHWLITAAPLVLLAPLLATILSMPDAGIAVLVASLALGTPTLLVLSAIGAALTLGLNRGGLLLSILVFPLVVPVIIFGARATDLAAAGEQAAPVLYLLGAILVLALILGPLAIAAALRISLD